MGNVINLRKFRKRKLREERAENAGQNRALFGTSGKLKNSAKIENKAQARQLDGKHLNPDDKA